MLNVEKMVIVG